MTSPAAPPPETTRTGYVALVGMPNAGKSSLLNQLTDQKLSIVTALPQTTRERVVGIDTRDGVQMILLDTPGLVEPRYLLQEAMLHAARGTLAEADVILLLLDGTEPPPALDEQVLRVLHAERAKLLPVLNKVDVAAADGLRVLERWLQQELTAAPLRVSALTGEGVPALRAAVAERLPRSPYLYPPEEVSSQPVRFFVEELVRETALEQFRQEVPYSVAVKVEEYREAADPVYIRATVFVERESQKGIMIGRGGSAIRELGRASREKVEALIGAPVYLDLRLKVMPKWRRREESLRRLGFTLP